MAHEVNRRQFLKLVVTSSAALAGVKAVAALPNAQRRSLLLQDNVEVSYGTPGGAVEDAAWEPVWAAFQEANPGMTVRYMPLGGNYGPDYVQALQALLAGGRAPDVFFVLDGFLASYASRGVLTPIDSYVEANPDIDLEDFFTAHLNSFRYEDQLWGLPRDGAPFAMFYNAQIYDDAGVERPTNELTWDEYLEQAKALTQRDASGRTTVFGASRGQWIDWVWQAGGDVFNEDGTQSLMDQPEAIEGLRFMGSLVTEHQVAPSEADLADQNLQDTFLAGRKANFMGARGALGAVCQQSFPFDAVLEPMGAVRVSRTNVGPTVIWSGSSKQDAAWELLKYIVSTEGQRLKISSGFAFPSRRSAAEQDWYTEFTCGEAVGDGINQSFLELVENEQARTWPTHPRWPEINTAVNSELGFLWSGDKSAEEVGSAIADQINAILAG
jgi:multiple sugar transport system substrate-binding protein